MVSCWSLVALYPFVPGIGWNHNNSWCCHELRPLLLAAVITNEKTSKEKCDAMVSRVSRTHSTVLAPCGHDFSALVGS